MVKVNMMCGKRNFGPDWVHIDQDDFAHVQSSGVGLESYDLNSIDLIYCSHGIAYFEPDTLKELLTRWINRLKPGGTLRIATPDYDQLRKFDLPKVIGPLYGRMELPFGEIFHKQCFNFTSLKLLLESCGFVDIERYDHTKTEHPNTGNREDFYDDHSAAYIDGVLISLNVQCRKP